ncbi:MAG: molybdopterin-binding protein [Clostridiales Family XIII bacterium]|jgi:molybdopterin biosynthesis enzyme|nr:molybdopterin-binding protein [Clostridiales Family XIII bacterium]
MKIVKTEDAVGCIVAHDMTQIIPGKYKGEPFKVGHVIQESDIPVLLSIGKEHVYVQESSDQEDDVEVHEDAAAAFLYELAADMHMHPTEVSAGRINAIANVDGIFRTDTARLFALNSLPDVTVSARHNYSIVHQGDMLFGARVTPLSVPRTILEEATHVVGEAPICKIYPFKQKKVGIVTTGKEVYDGIIEDGFAPVLRNKLAGYDYEEMGQVILPDEHERTTKAILDFIDQGADIILVTGGMSVDPDDRTPLAIKNTGAQIITYGTPIFPGAMLMLAYLGNVAILGVPGGAVFSKRTTLDILLPRLMADIKVSLDDINRLGNGGLCLLCKTCIFPNCGFGVE